MKHNQSPNQSIRSHEKVLADEKLVRGNEARTCLKVDGMTLIILKVTGMLPNLKESIQGTVAPNDSVYPQQTRTAATTGEPITTRIKAALLEKRGRLLFPIANLKEAAQLSRHFCDCGRSGLRP